MRFRTSRKKNQITVLGCANAVGQSQLPFVIFEAKQSILSGHVVNYQIHATVEVAVDGQIRFFLKGGLLNTSLSMQSKGVLCFCC